MDRSFTDTNPSSDIHPLDQTLMSVKGTTAQMPTPNHARTVRRVPTHVNAKTAMKGKTVQVWLFLQSVIKIVLYVCLYRAFLLMLELFYLVQPCWVKAETLLKKRPSEVITNYTELG